MNPPAETVVPEGLRDSQNWYMGVDPVKVVDHSLLDYVARHGGQRLLDLGCGLGGYAKLLQDRGKEVLAIDVNENYVTAARALGVDARVYDGYKVPFPDSSFDTIFMIEVLEHVPNVERLIPELRRVARNNVIVTVPNCAYSFNAPIVLNHMLDVDHKNFFNKHSLKQLLTQHFRNVEVDEVLPIDDFLAQDLLPNWLLNIWKWGRKLKRIDERYYFRLIANAAV